MEGVWGVQRNLTRLGALSMEGKERLGAMPPNYQECLQLCSVVSLSHCHNLQFGRLFVKMF